MTAIVDIYCRVATNSPESSNYLDEQEQACRKYCLENNLTIGTVYRECFSGSQYRERKMLSRMRERYSEGKIQGVVIGKFDRLSRSEAHLVILMEEMEQYNVTLHIVKEKIDNTPMGRLIRMSLALTAEVEREKALDNPES